MDFFAPVFGKLKCAQYFPILGGLTKKKIFFEKKYLVKSAFSRFHNFGTSPYKSQK